MTKPVAHEFRSQIRGITGALLVVGLTFHYTMETWWLAWILPLPYIVGFAFVGLTLVILVTRSIGFHKGEGQTGRSSQWRHAVIDFPQILLQSFIASYVILLLLGIIDLTSSLNLAVRLGLLEVVPLGFGAAMANDLLGSTDGEAANEETRFPKNLAVFTIGALFISSTIAPTQEMELIAVHMDWLRLLLLIVFTLVLIYLVLYELEFQGQQARIKQEWRFQVGTVFIVYLVGATVAFFLLLGFGHFIDATFALVYQETVILAFPASLGAAAAEVLI
jgi:putative integral membrane protein (TIGR02587 family)